MERIGRILKKKIDSTSFPTPLDYDNYQSIPKIRRNQKIKKNRQLGKIQQTHAQYQKLTLNIRKKWQKNQHTTLNYGSSKEIAQTENNSNNKHNSSERCDVNEDPAQ